MSERKETPDVLGNLLGNVPAIDASPSAAPRAARTPAQRKSDLPQQKPALTPVAPATQWEYREVIFRDFRGWRPRAVDGRERSDWKDAPLMLDYLRQAGVEGWELVNIGSEHNYEKTAYFKRPKS